MFDHDESGAIDPADDDPLPYADRHDAARRLAVALQRYANTGALVLAIPRGAVPMGRVLADRLAAELDVVLVRKLRAPGQPELALGAVDEDGRRSMMPELSALADESWIAAEAAIQMETLARRRQTYRAGRPAPDPAGRTVIVLDDGMATGATMISALRWVRAHHPSYLVCAVPVASIDALAHVRGLADEIVCPRRAVHFFAVSQYYLSFAQVSDDEVIRELAAAARDQSEAEPQASGRSFSKRSSP